MNFLLSDEQLITSYAKYLRFYDKHIYFDKLFYFFKKKKKTFLILGNIYSIKNKKFSFNSIKETILLNDYKSLIGRYVIIEVVKDKIKIIPDFQGRVDLFYFENRNKFKISSRIDDLTPFINKRINQPALAHSLSIYGFRSPRKNTIFEQINRVPPKAIVKIKKNLTIKEFNFIPRQIRPDVKIQEFYDYFMNSIENKSSKNGNLLSLSSGWDSTSILAALVKIRGKKKINCFIGRMKFSKQSKIINSFEIIRAKKIAQYYDVKLNIVDLDYTNKSSVEDVSNYISFFKKYHLVSLPALNQMKLCEKISKNYNGETFFTGEGSDGLQNFGFSQYATLYYDTSRDFREYSDKMMTYLFGPTFIKKIFLGIANNDLIFNFLKNEKNIKTKTFEPNQKKIANNIFISFFLRNIRFPNSSDESLKFLTHNGKKKYHDYFLKNYFKKQIEEFDLRNIYSYYLYNYSFFHWQSATSLSRDYAAGNFSINISHPFMDDELVKFFSEVPEHWGRGLDINNAKYALKSILRNKLDYPYYLQEGPHSYTYDIQPGFSIVNEFLNNSALKKFFIKKLDKIKFNEYLDKNFFNVSYVLNLLKKYSNNENFDNNEIRDLSSLIYHSNYL